MSVPATWHCEKHGLEVPIRALPLPFTDRPMNVREECPECEREAREWGGREMAERFERERVEATIGARLQAGVPQRFIGAALDEEAHGAVRDFAAGPEHWDVGLILLGLNGTGKTYQGCALVNHWLASGRTAAYATLLGFMLRIRATWDHLGGDWESEAEVIEHLTEADLLVVDEVGKGHESHWEWVIFNHIINERYAAKLPTVLVSNLGAGAFKALVGEGVVARYREGGRVVEFPGPSRRGRRDDGKT